MPESESVHPGSHHRLRAGPAWDDPARCDEAVAAGNRLSRSQFRIRVGTWNLMAFPERTDVGWLACALTWLDVDLLAAQEVQLTAAGREALDELMRQLSSRTNTAWYWVADSCPDADRFHSVLLYRGDRVHLSEVATHPQVDPTRRTDGTPQCPGNLRPALGAYVQSQLGGVDFHFVTTQLDAGQGGRDFGNRQMAWLGLGEVQLSRAALRADPDVVVAADFNSSGCAQRGIATDREEMDVVREVFAELKPPLVLADATEGCTHFVEGGVRHVDHVAVSAAMKEARGSPARVSGICAAAHCRVVDRGHAFALTRLSDHCPVVFDIIDSDED